jgi:hypothetical protein
MGRRYVSAAKLSSFAGLCVHLTLSMPYARFDTREIYWDLARNQKTSCQSKQDTGCRLSHQILRDLRVWQQIKGTEKKGRPIPPCRPDLYLHSDTADMGYGGTLGATGAPGECGLREVEGVWVSKDRSESITYRELRAVCMLLMGNLGEKILNLETKELLLRTDKTGVVHITNVPVSASQPMMRELRRLKHILENMGVSLITQWLPSVANKFADALSRRFHTDDLHVRRQLRCSILAGMKALIDAFPYRPFGEHPLFARR